jgi:hypothetical protein
MLGEWDLKVKEVDLSDTRNIRKKVRINYIKKKNFYLNNNK